MLLSELLTRANLVDITVLGDTGVVVHDLCVDSRNVTSGCLFIAVPGVQHNGAQFVPEALKGNAGALVLSADAKLDMPATIPVIRVSDVRAAVAKLAAAFFGQQPPYMMAVTGTDGKTSTAEFSRQFCQALGFAAASIGTLGLRSPQAHVNAAFPANNTSPEPILLHRTLRALTQAGVQYVAMEASSHGLDQKRMDGVNFVVGAFTNFTRDHLDYHGTLEAYFSAKGRLFSEVLPEGAHAVIHRDDARAEALIAIAQKRHLRITTFGGTHADITLQKITPHAGGLRADMVMHGKVHALDIPLYGGFQLYNIAAAMGMVHACGIPMEECVPHIARLTGVPGRLECAATLPNGALCFVDYAHTPAALENILRTLRVHAQGALHIVFGCGGDRDTGKRSEMGAVAARLADNIIVTDDNPRSEDPASIRASILENCPNAQEIGDRREAIFTAVKALKPGDVLVVAGKGHEHTQLIGDQIFPFNDAATLQEAAYA